MVECNSNQKLNNDKRQCECKNAKEYHMCEEKYIWNPATCSCQNGKYLGSIIDNYVITCDEIIEEAKTVTTKTFTANSISASFYILLAFLLINYSIIDSC